MLSTYSCVWGCLLGYLPELPTNGDQLPDGPEAAMVSGLPAPHTQQFWLVSSSADSPDHSELMRTTAASHLAVTVS